MWLCEFSARARLDRNGHKKGIMFFHLLLAAIAGPASAARLPVGVLTQPVPANTSFPGPYYSPSHYVSFVESGGARAVPVRHDEEAAFARIYAQIGGLWLPGGKHALLTAGTPYLRAVSYFVRRALADGDLAVGGNCLGLEALLVAVANDTGIMSDTADDVDVNMNLTLTPAAATSWLFAGAPPALLEAYAGGAVAYNHHGWGVNVSAFRASPALVAQFDVLATARSNHSVEYVAVVAQKATPPGRPPPSVFATMFESPCPQYCFYSPTVTHSRAAVGAMADLSARFVAAADAAVATRRPPSTVTPLPLPSALLRAQAREVWDDNECKDGCYFFA